VPAELTLIALALTTIVVIATKALTGSGTPATRRPPVGARGGRVCRLDGVTLILADVDHRFLISSVTFIMALLVAQTRVESGVHSSAEVLYGGLIGALVGARRLPGRPVTELVEKAEAVAERAYAPYSNYNVGAVVRTDDGREFDGVNVENAATRSASAPRRARSSPLWRRATAPAGSPRSGSPPRPAEAAASGWPSSGSGGELPPRGRHDRHIRRRRRSCRRPWDFPEP
jgi:hypothetical protein